jgi:hypothetical protein
VITISKQEVNFVKGENATIECTIEAYPPGINFWETDTGIPI